MEPKVDCACGKDDPKLIHTYDVCWRPCRGECGGEVNTLTGFCHRTHPLDAVATRPT